MTTPTLTPIKLQLSPTNLVRLAADPSSNADLLLTHDGSSPSNAVEVIYPDGTVLQVRLEIADADQWQVTATHGSHTWTRGQGCCAFELFEPVDSLRVEVKATKDGVSKSGPIFIKVQPQGVRPDL